MVLFSHYRERDSDRECRDSMRMIPVDRLEEGDLLGRGLYDPDGRLLLQQGVKLSSHLIEGIKKRGHQYIFVHRQEKHASGEMNYKNDLRQLTRDLLHRTFESLRGGGGIPQRIVVISVPASLLRITGAG